MTTREAAGLLGLALGYLVVGEALLAALGLVRSRAAAVAGAGLALLAGWAATGLVVALALMAGLSADAAEVSAAWAALLLAAAVVARVVPAVRESPARRRGRRSLVATAAQAILAGYLAALLVRSLVPLGELNPDAWSQWLLKAKGVYFLGGLDTGPDGFTSQANPDYPPLDTGLEATAFHFIGRADVLALPLLHWVVFAAFVAGVAFLLRPRVPAALLWPSLAMLVLAPKLSSLVGSSLADEPLALLVALAGVAGTLWLLEGEPRFAALCCLFLAAAALTKNEGLMLGIFLGLVLAAAARRRLGLALPATPLAAYALWKVWLRVHDVPSNFGYDFGRLLHPGTLAQDVDYLAYGARSLLGNLFAPSQWLLIVPAALVLGGVAVRRRSPLAAVGLAFPVLVVLGYSGIYWLGNGICTWMPGRRCDGTWHDIEWLVSPSADRIVASVALLLAAIFPLLLAEAAEATRRPARARASAAAAPAPPRG